MDELRSPEPRRSNESDPRFLSESVFDPKTTNLREYVDRADGLLRKWTEDEGLPASYAPAITWNGDKGETIDDWDGGRVAWRGKGSFFPGVSFNRRGVITNWVRGKEEVQQGGYPSLRALRRTFNVVLPQLRLEYRDDQRRELLKSKLEVAVKQSGLRGTLTPRNFTHSEESGSAIFVTYYEESGGDEKKKKVFLRAIPIAWREDLSGPEQTQDIDAQVRRNVEEAQKIEAGTPSPGIDVWGADVRSEEQRLRDENEALRMEIERLRRGESTDRR